MGKIARLRSLTPESAKKRLQFPDLTGIAGGHHQGRGATGQYLGLDAGKLF